MSTGRIWCRSCKGCPCWMDQRELDVPQAMEKLKALGARWKPYPCGWASASPQAPGGSGAHGLLREYTAFCQAGPRGQRRAARHQGEIPAIAALEALKKIYDGLAGS